MSPDRLDNYIGYGPDSLFWALNNQENKLNEKHGWPDRQTILEK